MLWFTFGGAVRHGSRGLGQLVRSHPVRKQRKRALAPSPCNILIYCAVYTHSGKPHLSQARKPLRLAQKFISKVGLESSHVYHISHYALFQFLASWELWDGSSCPKGHF